MKTRYYVSIIAICILPLLVVAFAELREQSIRGTHVPTLAEMLVGGTQELALTKATGNWQYKSKEIEKSQQKVALGGTIPTAYDNFNSVESFRIQTAASHMYNESLTGKFTGFDHQFNVRDGKVNKPGTIFNCNFYPRRMSSSPHHPKPKKVGGFKAKIKNGQIKFLYQVPKGKEAGMMVQTHFYGFIQSCRTQDWFKGYTKERIEGEAQVILAAGSEVSYGEANCRVKVGKSAGKTTLLKKK